MLLGRVTGTVVASQKEPLMDGLTFLRKLMHYKPMPVVVLSSRLGATWVER